MQIRCKDFAKLGVLAFKGLSIKAGPTVSRGGEGGGGVGGCWQRQQLHFHPGDTESERDRDSQGTRGHYASLLYFIYLPFIGADLRAQHLLKCLIDSLFPGGKNTEIKQNIFELPHPENKVH